MFNRLSKILSFSTHDGTIDGSLIWEKQELKTTSRSWSIVESRIWTTWLGSRPAGWTLSSLHIVKTLLEPSLDGFDLSNCLVEECIDLLLHLDVKFIVVFLELDGFDSLIHFSDQEAELILGSLFFLRIRVSCRWLLCRSLASFCSTSARRRSCLLHFGAKN